MALISIKRNVDLQPGLNAPAVFNCSQNDKGTTIMLGLMNGGNDYTVPSGVTITISGSRSNGAVFTPVSATSSGSTVSFTLTEEMTDTAGPTLCEAVLEQGNNVLGTANFIINVEGSPMGADVPPVFTDAAWAWMLGKLTTETVPALGDDVISSIQGKVDKSQGSTNAKKFLRVNTSGNVSLASTDKTLSVADQIADAKETGDQIRALDAGIDGVVTTLGGSISTLNGITTDLQSSKLDKNQGASNAGKTMVVDSSGNIVPGDALVLKANESTIAPEFDPSGSYTAGQYVYKNGVLYRFTADHAAGAWTGTDAEVVTVGGELTDLKADFKQILPQDLNTDALVSGSVIYSTGANGNSATLYRTKFVNIENCANIIYKRIHTTATNVPTWGMAFYSSATISAYISGQAAQPVANEYHYELERIAVPEGAKYARFTWNPSLGDFAVYDAEQYINSLSTKTDELESDIQDLQTDNARQQTEIEDRLVSGNLINLKTLLYNSRLQDGGAIESSSAYVVTDFIPVIPGETLYKTGTMYLIGAYDATKTYLSAISIGTLSIKIPANVYYIRVCMINASAESAIISRNQTAENKYGYYPKTGISGIDVSEQISGFMFDNAKDAEERLKIVSYIASSCNVLPQKEYALDANNGYILSGNSAIDARFTTEAYTTYGITVVDFYVYIVDSTKITSISFIVASGTYSFTSLSNGWNKLRGYAYAVTLPNRETATNFRVTAVLTGNTQIYFAKAVVKRAEKANLILVEDGGYNSFLTDGYPTLLQKRIPVTWAINPGRIGVGEVISQAAIDTLALDGNSEFSFHSYNPNERPTANMSESEIQADVAKCLKYLRSNGLAPAHIWRAAHAQNNAPAYAAEIGMVEALATYNSAASVTVFPFPNRWNVPRLAIHARTTEFMDNLFSTLEKTHSTVILYTHGISSDQYDISADRFEYLISKIDDGVSSGWLRPTTYSRLVDTPSAWLD